MARGEKLISSKVLYDGRVFGVRRDRFIAPGGYTVSTDLVTHEGSVAVLPVFPDGRILLVRQYRHAAKRFLWELCAGRKDPGESWMTAAQRELREETGFRAGRLRRILAMYPTPGFLSERLIVYVAERLRHDPAAPDEDERITTRLFTLPELLRWFRGGRIIDAKSIASVLFYARFHR
jgi:ADP-ribose pyrophosphatase